MFSCFVGVGTLVSVCVVRSGIFCSSIMCSHMFGVFYWLIGIDEVK